jgi:hypothetical protein
LFKNAHLSAVKHQRERESKALEYESACCSVLYSEKKLLKCRFERHRPKTSQIGVDFRDSASIGVELRGFAFPITRCPNHQITRFDKLRGGEYKGQKKSGTKKAQIG